MAGVRKLFNRDDVIKQLTVAHDGCTNPDQTTFTAEQLEGYDDEWLKNYRGEIKRLRPLRMEGTSPTTRETFSKTGKCSISVDIELDESQRKALATLGYKTAAAVSTYLGSFVSSRSETGPGARSFIPKDDRPTGMVTFNVNGVVSAGVDGVAEKAEQHKLDLKMEGAYESLKLTQSMYQDINDPKRMNDDEIQTMLADAAEGMGHTPEQIELCIAHVYKGGDSAVDLG